MSQAFCIIPDAHWLHMQVCWRSIIVCYMYQFQLSSLLSRQQQMIAQSLLGHCGSQVQSFYPYHSTSYHIQECFVFCRICDEDLASTTLLDYGVWTLKWFQLLRYSILHVCMKCFTECCIGVIPCQTNTRSVFTVIDLDETWYLHVYRV